ncbi:integrase, catalytic region, zinc finger, CCHC-type containing protein [Tanacetum coccineum]
MAASSPVCLMSKSTSTKSWLWHRRLSHLNFGTINDLTKHHLVDGLLNFKYGKDHLCSACEQGKRKKDSHPPKVVPNTREQSGQPVMTREEDDGIFEALDPQTLCSGFCVSTEWEVVFLGGTTLAEVILVKGYELPTIVKVMPVGFHLSPTSVNT